MDLRELQAEYIRQQRQVTDERIAMGALIRTILSESDGLILKEGRTEKPKREVYPEFLDYDSYVDCGELFSIPIDRLKQGEFFGFLTDEDRNGIFDLLETSDIFSTKQKKRYGIHRR